MNPYEIERSSFEIIRYEMAPHDFSDAELAVVVRAIHATGDFDYQHNMRFHPRAVEVGIAALRAETAVILTDVRMVEVGIGFDLLTRLNGRKFCDIAHPAVRRAAQVAEATRAAVAMRRNADVIHGGIVAIGNAPTALLEVIRLVQEESIRPALVVGVPVGFVNAVESKDALIAAGDALDVPYITAVGRKGGSPVAAAVVNALMRLALA